MAQAIEKMAVPAEVHIVAGIKDLNCKTAPRGGIGTKGLFRGMSNLRLTGEVV
jgi:hypothetical protein